MKSEKKERRCHCDALNLTLIFNTLLFFSLQLSTLSIDCLFSDPPCAIVTSRRYLYAIAYPPCDASASARPESHPLSFRAKRQWCHRRRLLVNIVPNQTSSSSFALCVSSLIRQTFSDGLTCQWHSPGFSHCVFHSQDIGRPMFGDSLVQPLRSNNIEHPGTHQLVRHRLRAVVHVPS